VLAVIKMRYVFTDPATATKAVPPDDIREILLAHHRPAD
jgi:hypothetical protein